MLYLSSAATAQHLDPTLLPPGKFTGAEPPEEIQKFRSRLINALRQRQLFKYLEHPIDNLLPDPRKYGNSQAGKRKLEEDTERKQAEAGQAYAMVRARSSSLVVQQIRLSENLKPFKTYRSCGHFSLINT